VATVATTGATGVSLFGSQPAKLAMTTPLAMVTAAAATRIRGWVVLAAAVGTVWIGFKGCLRKKGRNTFYLQLNALGGVETTRETSCYKPVTVDYPDERP
jgi:hypothetical protein